MQFITDFASNPEASSPFVHSQKSKPSTDIRARAHVRTQSYLDKSEQLGTDLFPEKLTATERTLRNRANAKFFSSKLSSELSKIDESELQHSYNRSLSCNSMIVQIGKSLQARYCGCRWCNVCNRIRTAKLIIGYEPVLKAMQNKYFVTLTLPNVQNYELRPTINYMMTTSKQIQERIKKRRLRKQIDFQLVGMRKLECTYNAKEDSYHPHFHFIIEGESAAYALLQEWLQSVPTANRAAQDIRPAELNSEKELFKYFSKFVSKTGKGKNVVIVRAMDNVFCSIVNRRVFQPIGIKKFVEISEDIGEVQSQYLADLPFRELTHWTWYNDNWYDENGEILCNYLPSKAQRKFVAENFIS